MDDLNNHLTITEIWDSYTDSNLFANMLQLSNRKFVLTL